MCAITAWAGQINPWDAKHMLKVSQECGPHSVGISYVNKDGNIEWWKRAVTAEMAIRNNNRRIDKWSESTLAMGHTRWATHGRVTDMNAHPFVHENIVFAHNGIISNYRDIMPNAVVDSECLGILIEQRDISPACGSVGLVWFEIVDGVASMFAYRHHQGLGATVVSLRDGTKMTIVASRRQHAMVGRPTQLMLKYDTEDLEEGVAYKITPEGPIEAWRNPRSAAFFERKVSAVYRGG